MKLAIASLVLALAACGGGSSNNTIDSPPSVVQSVSCGGVTPAATVTVTGTSTFMFSPSTVSIHVNDVVRFNTTSFHPVASGSAGTPDGKFSTNGDGCFKFTQAGTFPFFCSVHLFTGTVTVQ
jgi:plastocyanin